MKIPNRTLPHAALVCLAGPALLATVVVSGPGELTEDGIANYEAVRSGSEPQPRWHWSVASGVGTIISQGEGASAAYRAPRNLVEPQAVTLRATSADGEHTGDLVIRVHPDTKAGGLRIKRLSGNPAERGNQEGSGQNARFQELARAVWLGEGHPDTKYRGKWLLVDRASHQLVTLTRDGRKERWMGEGKAGGFQDGTASQALFDEPTDFAIWPQDAKSRPGFALVADSGNHCLRLLKANAKDTQVRTFAGKGTEPGYRDGSLLEARFSAPRGIAIGPDGTVYVADTGNGMIRRIASGQVTVLAGRLQNFWERKQVDGRGAGASFRAPEHLVVDPRNGNLYVSDFCAIRRVAPDGTVTTVAGVLTEDPFEYGFNPKPQEGKSGSLAGVPCLNHPKGLALQGSLLHIADHGNHAVRILNVDTGRLITLAGDGSPRAVKEGRPRTGGGLADAVEDDPDSDGFAALAYPTDVALHPHGGCLIVLGAAPVSRVDASSLGLPEHENRVEAASCVLVLDRDRRDDLAPAQTLPVEANDRSPAAAFRRRLLLRPRSNSTPGPNAARTNLHGF